MTGPKYPNQQLRSVSLETYFPGRLSAYAVFGQVQDAVAERLAHLFVPNVQEGEALALRPFQLRDSEQRRSLAVAVNQASYISFDYPGAEHFLAEAFDVLRPTLELLSPSKLTRVIYRYENELSVSRLDDGSIALDRLFPGVIPGRMGVCASIDSKAEMRWKSDAMAGTVGHHVRVEQESGLELLRVNVSCTVETIAVAQLKSSADEAHRRALAHFESIISDEYRQYISGSEGGGSS